MFKLESYITPLLMGYVDKYVKLRPEDFQLSLWGGDAVLYNLDLRLDVIEKAMQLPIVFQSGHIHELRLHIPWTKLGSDPVVVTMNTVECIFKLRDTAYKDRKSSKAGSETPHRSRSSGNLRAKKQEAEDLPPGYLQSLMNKIVNNVSIIVNNLIVKFVEEDIVLSLNVKSAEVYSVDKDWNRSYVELSAPDYVLRRAVNVCDLTACLDKRDASGKIEHYQDPLVYRCSILGRLYSKYEGPHGKYLLETKLNFYCERLDYSLTDTQLPLLVRLIEMCMALYYGTLEFKGSEAEPEPDTQDVSRDTESEKSVGEPPPELMEQQQGWASWAWSYVPQILPEDEEKELDEDGAVQPRRKPPATVVSIGMYAHKMTIKFKLTEYLKEKAHYGPRKIAFRPFLYLESEGIAMDVLMQGLTFFNAQFGVTNLRIYTQGMCICGADGEENARNQIILSGGDILANKTTSNYVCQSLFDQQSPENLGIPASMILDFEEHRQVYTEQYGTQKFGVFWMDYLYGMPKSEEEKYQSNLSTMSSGVLEDGTLFIHEYALTRFLIGQCHLNVASTTVHRIQKVLDAAYKYEYEPYTKKQTEHVDENRPSPTEEQMNSLEEFIPTRTYHLTLLEPIISVLSAEHAHCDIAKKTYRSHHSSHMTRSSHGPTLHPLYGIQLSSQRFDLQVTSPMYPRKLVKLVSKIAGPSSNLLHHCHSHTQIKLFGFHIGLTRVDVSGSRSPMVTLVPSCSGALYTRRLLLPMYWSNSYLPKVEKVYELPQMSLTLTKSGLLVALAVVSSWKQKVPKPSDILATSLMEDVFPSLDGDKPAPQHPVLEVMMSGFEMKVCRNDLVTACSGTVSSIQAAIKIQDGSHTKVANILSASSYTESLHTADWLIHDDGTTKLEENKNDYVSFTYQLPQKPDHIQAPAAVLLNLEGTTCCLDPFIMDWLKYTPTCKIAKPKRSDIKLDFDLAKAASPLQTNISQVSQASSGSKRPSVTVTQSPTTGHQSTVPTNQKEEGGVKHDDRPGTVGDWLAQIFPLVRVVQVQVDVKKVCIFFPRNHIEPQEGISSIAVTMETLARSRSLPDTLVLCLPHVLIQSTGLKIISFLQEIPITSMEGSLVGDKIPWNLSLRNFSVYTLHSCGHVPGQPAGPGVRALQLVKPTSVSCTVGVSYKYTPPTSDNISSLGLCLHTDMPALKVATSAEQIKLILDISGQGLKLAGMVSGLLSEVSKSLSVDKPDSEPMIRPTSPHPPQYDPNTTSITEEPLTQTTSEDVTSLDTTPSRELEILDTGSEGVKLSLWIQWTLPKLEISLYTKGKKDDVKLSILLEEITMSVDVQEVYSKLKLNMGAANVLHVYRASDSSTWQKGCHHGVLMSCRDDLSRNTHIISSKLWSADQGRTSTSTAAALFLPNQPARELTHGFLNLTFTRALRKNVKKKFQKLNVENPPAECATTSLSQFHFHKYVSEICISLGPCDFIVCASPLLAIMKSFASFGTAPKPKKNLPGTARQSSKGRSSSMPWFNSSNIPLIYADFATVRVFIPGESTDGESRKGDKIETTIDHDMVMMQVQSVSLLPHADNPLPRYAVERELYMQAVQLGVTAESGATLRDRQFQLDIKGFNVTTGCWVGFLLDESMRKSHTSSPAIQIPAVEWNSLKAFQSVDEDIRLFPIVSPCDLRLVAAPAIVNKKAVYGHTQLQDFLVCGYSLELNITSDLDLHVSTNQIALLHKIAVSMLKEVHDTFERSADLPDDREVVPDSGIGSDISTVTVSKVHLDIPQVLSADDNSTDHGSITPADILLTAGRISCIVYSHKVVEKEMKVETAKIPAKRKRKRRSKVDLEWRIDLGTENDEDECTGYHSVQYQEPAYLMNMYETQRSINEVISAGSVCISPFLFLYISQPHTVLSCHRDSQKFEMSCFDVLVKGPVEKSCIEATDVKLMPDCSNYTQYWLETKAGQLDQVTGIPPCLYTLTVTDFLHEPACIRLKFGRPLKANVSFVKFKQVQSFLECLVPSSDKDLSSKAGSRSDPQGTMGETKSASAGLPAVLNKIHQIELLTDQVVVSMETISCDEAPGLTASFSNLRIEAMLQHNLKGDIASIAVNSYVRDVLLKTAFCDNHLPLIGPTSVKVDGTYTHCCLDDTHFLSQCVVTVATGLLMVNLGQEHVLCLKMIGEHCTQLLKSLAGITRDAHKPEADDTEPGPSCSREPEEFVVHTSCDDLRSGDFQYIEDTDGSGMLASPGEIIFCNQNRGGNSTMTWSYSQPRIISLITSTPIPFNQSEDSEETKVVCRLQYWEPLIQQFVDYVNVNLSESDITQTYLPDVRATHAHDLVTSQNWRIIIHNTQIEPVVFPAALAASMKVDSCFVPSLIPSLQLGLTLESVEIHVSNHAQCLGTETPTKLYPFFMSNCYPATGEFAMVNIDNLLLAGSHLSGQRTRTQGQFSMSLCVDLLEYKTLTMQKVVSPTEISGSVSLQPLSKPPMVDLDMACSPVTLTLGQGVVHTISSAAQAWSHIFTDGDREVDEVVFGQYVVCNDTQQPIRYGQVGTDENLLLQPREMHQYGWRSHKIKQQVHLCLDGKIWKWCEPVDINTMETVVRQVTCTEQQYTLIIKVCKLSNAQIQVIISGQMIVTNRLSQHMEIRLITSGSDQGLPAVVGANQTVPSYILEPVDIQGLKLRPWGSKGAWCKEVCVAGPNVRDNNLIKINLSEKSSFHIWVRVISQKLKSAEQIYVVLCPLYSVRSHLPHPLYMNIDTSKLNLHEQLQISGQGRDVQLMCVGGDIHHALTFQFSTNSGKSSSGVTLSTGLIDQLERAPVSDTDWSSLASRNQQKCTDWPYVQELSQEDMVTGGDKQSLTIPDIASSTAHPTTDLSVSLSELWPGCPTILVDVTPSFILNNMCHMDLIVMGTEDTTFNLPRGQTICPPKVEGSLHLGLTIGDNVCMSGAIPVSEEEVDAKRYRNDIGRTLYLDSFVNMPIICKVDEQTQVYFVTVTSAVKHHIRVITVRETFVFTNLTPHCLSICPFTIPKWSKRVHALTAFSCNLSKHRGLSKDENDIQPLTFHPLVYAADANTNHEIDNTTDFVQYISIKKVIKQAESVCSSSSTEDESADQSKNTLNSDWSFPVRLVANENGCRMTVSLTVEEGEECVPEALCISGQVKNGITYYIVDTDSAPVCCIHNKCSFPLVFGQTSMNLTLLGTTIHEQTELVDTLPTIPGGSAVFYTPPFSNATFPQISDKQSIPRIHFSTFCKADCDWSDFDSLKWSQPISLHLTADSFISIPGVADLKVHIQQVAMVMHVAVEPISKADVSAKEIRSRLKGKERTIVLESSQIMQQTEEQIVSSMKTAVQPENISRSTSVEKPIEVKNKVKQKSKFEKKFQISCGILFHRLSVVIQDELSSITHRGELLRYTIDDMFIASYPASSLTDRDDYHRSCIVFSVGDIQLDNQVQQKGNYDFPVVLVRQEFDKPLTTVDAEELSSINVIEKHAVLKSCSLIHVQVVLGTVRNRNAVIESVEVSCKPVSVFVDDTFLFRCIKEFEGFVPTPLSYPDRVPPMLLRIPTSVKCTSRVLCSPVQIGHLSMQPLSILLSVHASLKLFIASDHTPLSFGKFERFGVCTSSHQLTKDLVMHYASGALFRAGAVVGSLEILGNPTGLIRSIGTGVADFFRMPYRGLTQGPGAFVMGVSSGTSSMVKNITTGMLKSVTDFASSVSRNMDRLSLDGSHVERQEANRRHRPDGLGVGLKQGLTGLGINLLGAVAGLADQPIQSIVNSPGDSAQSRTSTASNIMTGMGKGLVGVFTKPIGGAAEFVSQTGQGILHGTGLSTFPKLRCKHDPEEVGAAPCGQLKYAMKLLQSLPSNEMLICVEALHIDMTGSHEPVSLILTPEILLVVNHDEDSQQQSFSVLELECGVTVGENPVLSVIWKDSHAFTDGQLEPSTNERVTAFIDGTVRYAVPAPAEPAQAVKYGQLGPNMDTRNSSIQNRHDQNNMADTGNGLVAQGKQFQAEEEGQLSDCVSESSSEAGVMNTDTFPKYDFYMSATRLAAFLAIFNITKHQLESIGFAV